MVCRTSSTCVSYLSGNQPRRRGRSRGYDYGYGRKQHKLKGFGRLEREVNEEFDKMMKSASERLTEMCKIEKRVWNKHEDVVNQYDDLITEVDDRTEKQVCVCCILYTL